MTPITIPAAVRRTLRAPISASAIGLVVLAVAAGPASAAPSLRAGVVDGTLVVAGSPLADRIALRLSATDQTQLQIDLGDNGSADASFNLASFGAIDVLAGNGDDTVRIDQANGVFTTTKTTRIDGQNGDDTILGGSGNEVLVGGRGDDVIDGNGGADTAFLGKGDDTFIWDPGDASDIVEGQSGSDTLVFNGAGGDETMAATAFFGRVQFTRVQGGIVMDLDGVEVIDVRALGGADNITVDDLGGTDVRRVDVDLAGVLGGSAADDKADTVAVNGTKGDDTIVARANGSTVEVSGLAELVRITHTDPTKDKLVIDPVTGVDSVSIDPALAGLILASVL